MQLYEFRLTCFQMLIRIFRKDRHIPYINIHDLLVWNIITYNIWLYFPILIYSQMVGFGS